MRSSLRGRLLANLMMAGLLMVPVVLQQLNAVQAARAPAPPARVILARARAEALRMRTLRDTVHFIESLSGVSGKQKVQATIEERVRADMYVRRSVRERASIAISERANGRTVLDQQISQIVVGQKQASRTGGSSWSCGTSTAGGVNSPRNLLDNLFPGLSPEVTSAALVGRSFTFGVPTWFVRVTYIDTTLFRAPVPVSAGLFISRVDYKLVRVVGRSKVVSQGVTAAITEYERIGHYHERLRVRLPLTCSLYYGGY